MTMRNQIAHFLAPLMAAALLAGCTAIDDATDGDRTRAGGRPGFEVSVAPGETLDDVAARLGVSRGVLIRANRLQLPYTLQEGQALYVPPPATYEVQPDDTVEGIAVRLGVDEDALAAANGLHQPYLMRVGQILRVPGGVSGESAPAMEAAEPGFEGPPPPPRATISAEPLPPPPSSGSPSPGPGLAPQPIVPQAIGPQAMGPPPAYPHGYPPPTYAQPSPPAYTPPAYTPPAYNPPPASPAPQQRTIPPAAAPSQAYAPPTVIAPPQPSSMASAPPSSRPAPPPPTQMAEATAPAQPKPVVPPRAEPPAQPAAAVVPPAPDGTPHFLRPVSGAVVQGFGPDGSGQTNEGINIAAPMGTPVRAAAAGTVIYAGNELPAFGNLLLIRHDGGWVTAYGHLDTMAVQRGAAVTQGQTVGTVGQTGSAKNPQLHFEVRQGSKPVDPAPFLKG